MAKPTAEEFLAHHGVLGMHWGQHKAAPAASRQSKTPAPKKLSRRAQLAKAGTYQDKHGWEDHTSSKTAKIGQAAQVAAASTLGTYAISRLARDPRVKMGANAVTILLGGTSLGLIAGERRSSNTDIINAYKDKK